MRVLFYFGHPAQYLFLRETIKQLSKETCNSVVVVIKTKDVLENLLIEDGISYINILPEGRGQGKLNILLSLIKRIIKLIPIVLKTRSELLVGTDASIAQVSLLLRRKSITITEDDYEVIKTLADLTYPFTNTILCPKVCNVGKWEHKKVGYSGYMKLGYLHPEVFSPNLEIVRRYNLTNNYALIRLAQLTAHHDFGISGIQKKTLDKIITILEAKGLSIYISSESVLDEKYSKYRLKINPKDIHHVLAEATIFISDSQSMSVEAAMLGVPSIRISDFSGRISVLEELQNIYSLTYGINPKEEDKILEILDELLSMNDLKKEFQLRRTKMLQDKINVSAFLTWFLKNYPQSVAILKNNAKFEANYLEQAS